MKSMKLIVAALALVVGSADALGARGRVYVKQNAVGANDGTSWANAYTDLQSALAFAAFFGGKNVEVWVAKGTYKPTAGASRTATFSIPTDLYIYGGFAGTETSLSQRTDPMSNPTFLSGAIGGPTSSDNSYHVVTMIAPGEDMTIDGFVITAGNADGASAQNQDRGGGMFINGWYPKVRNCRFLANNAVGQGGALYIAPNSFFRFTKTIFDSNSASGVGPGNKDGGAVYTASDGYFSHCTFVGNVAAGNAGAVYVFDTLCGITNCVMSGNTAWVDGGAVYTSGEWSQLSVVNCTIARNHAGDECGGVRAIDDASVSLRNSILWGNTDSNAGTTTLQAQALSPIPNQLLFSLTSREGDGVSPNPQFVDPDGADNFIGTADDNYRLSSGSPAIDAGSSSNLGSDGGDIDNDGDRFEAVPLDMDLNVRRIQVWSAPDTGAGAAPMPDRGAYEFVPPPCVGDFNGDGQRNTADLALLLGVFGQPLWMPLPQDINGDGAVNTADLTAFLASFGVPCP